MGKDLTGGCLCGEVRYRITAAPVEALYCHCRMCQRAHGAPVIAWLTVPLDAFAVTKGDPVAYRSSAKAFRHFCGSCGTPLTWREADNPRLVDISIASLDNPEALRRRCMFGPIAGLPGSRAPTTCPVIRQTSGPKRFRDHVGPGFRPGKPSWGPWRGDLSACIIAVRPSGFYRCRRLRL